MAHDRTVIVRAAKAQRHGSPAAFSLESLSFPGRWWQRS